MIWSEYAARQGTGKAPVQFVVQLFHEIIPGHAAMGRRQRRSGADAGMVALNTYLESKPGGVDIGKRT